MGEILGVGLTHYPPLIHTDENMAAPLKYILRSPGLPEQYRRPENWPEPMRREWGEDGGASTARRHREALVTWFRKARQELDDFAPDFVLIRGDDQYENFKENVIPAFCVLAYDATEARPPWTEEFGRMLGPNVWGETVSPDGDRGQRPARGAELVLLGRGYGGAGAETPGEHLDRDLGAEFEQMFCLF